MTASINPKYISLIEASTSLRPQQIRSTIQLLEEGATVPFIARYRKEMTGSLDEIEISDIQKAYKKLQEIEKRKETILKSIEEQGKMTDALKNRIDATYDLTELEDIYLPYKRKRRTRAAAAREKGLQELADRLFQQHHQDRPQELAAKYINDAVAD